MHRLHIIWLEASFRATGAQGRKERAKQRGGQREAKEGATQAKGQMSRRSHHHYLLFLFLGLLLLLLLAIVLLLLLLLVAILLLGRQRPTTVRLNSRESGVEAVLRVKLRGQSVKEGHVLRRKVRP